MNKTEVASEKSTHEAFKSHINTHLYPNILFSAFVHQNGNPNKEVRPHSFNSEPVPTHRHFALALQGVSWGAMKFATSSVSSIDNKVITTELTNTEANDTTQPTKELSELSCVQLGIQVGGDTEIWSDQMSREGVGIGESILPGSVTTAENDDQVKACVASPEWEEDGSSEGQVFFWSPDSEEELYLHPSFDYPEKITKYKKTIFRQTWGILQRLPRPMYLLVMWCRRASPIFLDSHRCRALVLSSLLLLGITLLSIPNVPERFLGIRSPEQVRQTFLITENTSLESNVVVPLAEKQHSLQRRHIPHKFWARARPHNKFVKKKRRIKSQYDQGEKKVRR